MSLALISRSPDLQRLRNEGYNVEVHKGYLLVNSVPYVNTEKKVQYGALVSRLELAGDSTTKPGDHVALWAGDFPCDSKGLQMSKLVNSSTVQESIREGLMATHSFSHKPQGGYENYYEKMTSYVHILEGEARAIDPNVTARTFTPVKLKEDESIFCYVDSASSRAGIADINGKLEKHRIAIVGLGGTGAYVLDLIAKTSVGEIHLFDQDSFLQHNAFRSPGAPSFEELAEKPTKVAWFAQIYSKMRRKIFAHPYCIDDTNVDQLKSIDFVFLCLDKGESRRIIARYLIENKIPFIDVGIDLKSANGALDGSLRITTCTQSSHEHLARRIHFTDGEDNDYSRNIQIAEMNALNAALAVIRWKKMMGFYHDFSHEHQTVYSISTSALTNEEIPNETKEDQA